jgi:ParB family chromosome partitioning protein
MADVTTEVDGIPSSAPRRPDMNVPIEKLRANPDQPRRTFAQAQRDELAASIKEKGIIQPLIVRSVDGGAFEIVAGERRWRAAQMAQLHDIPVIVREFYFGCCPCRWTYKPLLLKENYRQAMRAR